MSYVAEGRSRGILVLPYVQCDCGRPRLFGLGRIRGDGPVTRTVRDAALPLYLALQSQVIGEAVRAPPGGETQRDDAAFRTPRSLISGRTAAESCGTSTAILPGTDRPIVSPLQVNNDTVRPHGEGTSHPELSTGQDVVPQVSTQQ